MSTKEIDVYKEWLGIADTARPLNHYQLLRLKQFEDDAGKVREHYRKMNAHVRKYASGDFAAQSQKLLNELAKAMLCLTDARRKSEYDLTLGRKDAGQGKRLSFEELLLSRKVVDPAQLAKARTFANTINVEVRDAVVQQKLAKSDTVMQLYAESIGLPFIDLSDTPIDESLVPRVPTYLARQHSCAPVMIDDNQVIMATPNPLVPDVEEELRLRIGMPVRTVLCTTGQINEAIQKYYGKDAAAAEMASKGSAPPKTAAAAADQPAGSAAAAPSASPISRAEQKKKNAMAALMGFNFAFMASMFAQMMLRNAGFMSKLGYSAVAGLAVAVVVYAVVSLKK